MSPGLVIDPLGLGPSHLPGLHDVEVVELGRAVHELAEATKELLCLRPVGRFHRDFAGFELDEAEVVAGSVCIGHDLASQGF